MADIDEFRRRLAAGELDGAVQRLLEEMNLWSPNLLESGIPPPAGLDAMLSRGRLLGRSTLWTLIDAGQESSAEVVSQLAAGKQCLVPISIAQPTAEEPQRGSIEITAPDRAVLKYAALSDSQLLDMVGVAPHVGRETFDEDVALEGTIVQLPPDSTRLEPAPETVWPLYLPAGDQPKYQPAPEFTVTWDSASREFIVGTPVQRKDAEELLALATMGNNPPTPIILERSAVNIAEFVGRLSLPDNLAATNPASVRVVLETIDLYTLPALSPQVASLWLATQPMIAMPLNQIDGGYEFTIYPSDREFLRQHSNSILAIRIASVESEGAK